MIKITLDTNLLIYFFDLDTETEAVSDTCDLFKFIIDSNNVDLKITTVVEDDVANDQNVSRRNAMLFRIQKVFSTVGAGYLKQDNGDLIPEDSSDNNNWNELKRIIFPNINKSQSHYKNKINDLAHLYRHLKNNRQVYVTNDKDFLKKSKEITSAFNTLVMSPKDCVSYLESVSIKKDYKHISHPTRPDYYSEALSGDVSFDFTNNDHIFTIGKGDLIFDTRWSECSNDKMYAYNDPNTIESIAIAENVNKFKDIKAESFYDFTSRAREVTKQKDILILKNSKGFFATVKIIDIKSKSRGSDKNELHFKYLISKNRTCSFKGAIPAVL